MGKEFYMVEGETIRLADPVNERDHVMGPATALVTVVYYGDYESPDCQERRRAIEKMAGDLVNRVRFVYRHFPLMKVHPHALRASEAAEAAAAQGKFWEMHRLLYLHPDKLENKDLREYARQIGLDLDRFDREMANGVYAGRIREEFYSSLTHGITGAPTTFINGELYALSGEELIEQVKTILENIKIDFDPAAMRASSATQRRFRLGVQ
jgi:protein-disulfide isomerase